MICLMEIEKFSLKIEKKNLIEISEKINISNKNGKMFHSRKLVY